MNLQRSHLLAMMIRAAMLDGGVAREAAADLNGNGKALTALLVALAVPVGVGLIFGSSYMMSAAGLTITVVTLAISIAASLVSLALMSATSKAIVGRRIGFGELFRGLAYAQSPALLTFLPVIGMIANLWRLPTTMVAVRDLSGSTLGRAFGLLLVGALASIILMLMLSPILIGMISAGMY